MRVKCNDQNSQQNIPIKIRCTQLKFYGFERQLLYVYER